MKIQGVEGNRQKLDGGAMFGNCPKALWERWIPADASNRISLAARSMLLQSEEAAKRNILVDVGIGAFFEPKLKQRFGVEEEEHTLLNHLNDLDLDEADIDGIILSHLHFDHAGGLLSAWDGTTPRLHFPKATYYVGKEHWEYAQKPHKRERASFLPHLHQLLLESGRLKFIEGDSHPDLSGFTFSLFHGHSRAVLLPEVETEQGPILFINDLCPGVPWLHLPITMGYDRFPELLVDEKTAVLEDLYTRKGKLFFTHDPDIALTSLGRNEKGQYEAHQVIHQ